MQYPELQLYIGGEWKRADGQPVINPADETTLAHVPTATRSDLDAALSAAQDGFRIWSRTSPRQARGNHHEGRHAHARASSKKWLSP